MSLLESDQKRLKKLDELFKLRLDKYIKLPIVSFEPHKDAIQC